MAHRADAATLTKANDETKAGKVSLHVYINERLKKRVRAAAKSDRRHINAQVEVLLERALDAWDVAQGRG